MKRVLILSFVGLLTLSSWKASAEALDKPNAIIVEGLGKAGLYSVAYERLFIDQLSAGVGFSYWNFFGLEAFLIPIYVNFYPISGTHRLILTGGMDVIIANLDLGEDGWGSFGDTGIVGFIAAGYELRLDQGFVFRAQFPYILFGEGGLGISGGLSFGAAF